MGVAAKQGHALAEAIVDSGAGRVEYGFARKACGVIQGAGSERSAEGTGISIGQRIGIRELRHVADDATGIRRPRQGARGLSWNLLDGGTRRLAAQPFVREEKEQFVLDDRTAD